MRRVRPGVRSIFKGRFDRFEQNPAKQRLFDHRGHAGLLGAGEYFLGFIPTIRMIG